MQKQWFPSIFFAVFLMTGMVGGAPAQVAVERCESESSDADFAACGSILNSVPEALQINLNRANAQEHFQLTLQQIERQKKRGVAVATASKRVVLNQLKDCGYKSLPPCLLPYGSRVGQNYSVLLIEGFGSDKAQAFVAHTRDNAKKFCEEYVGDGSETCISETLREVQVKPSITANCKTGMFYDMFGKEFRFRGKQQSRKGDTEYVIYDVEASEILEGCTVCGYVERIAIYDTLCLRSKSPR